MTQVLFRKASNTGTTGVWFAKVNTDLREFCSRAYGTGLRIREEHLKDCVIKTFALNMFGYSLQLWYEV